MSVIDSVASLREIYRPAAGRAVAKQLDRLDVHCRRFIALSPFLVLASSRASGPADCSPRGGEPGFVKCLDAGTLVLPDSPGNNRLDTLENVIANPEVALLFLVPGVDETLRVNGLAEVHADEQLCGRLQVGARPPATVLIVRVREAFLHCAKSLMRSRLWDPSARVERDALPSMGEMLKDQTGSSEAPESTEAMIARYRDVLY